MAADATEFEPIRGKSHVHACVAWLMAAERWYIAQYCCVIRWNVTESVKEELMCPENDLHAASQPTLSCC